MEPMTAAAIMGGTGVAKGVSGYKAGQASSKSAAATAAYNRQISELNAKMEQDRGVIVRSINEHNADIGLEKATYDAFLIERQAVEVQDQNDFDMVVAERQYDIFTSEKRARWGTSGVTMQGSPAVVALADAHAAATNLANIELRGIQAVSKIQQTADMTRYQGRSNFNAAMQSAYLQQYQSDINRANIINEGNMNYYAGMSKSYQAQQQATAALIGGISDGISAGVGAYGSAGGFASSGSTLTPGLSGSVGGGGFTSLRGGTGPTQIPIG